MPMLEAPRRSATDYRAFLARVAAAPDDGTKCPSGPGRPAVDWPEGPTRGRLRRSPCRGRRASVRPERGALRGDVVAGITVAAYLVPQVLAYSGLARVPPAAGLWAAFVALAVYFLLGSSPQLSVGPESTTALMTGAALATLAVTGGLRAGHRGAARPRRRRGVPARVGRRARLPRRPPLQAGARGLHGRHRRSHGPLADGSRERRRRPRRHRAGPDVVAAPAPAAGARPDPRRVPRHPRAAAGRRPPVAHRSGAAGRHARGDPRRGPRRPVRRRGGRRRGRCPSRCPRSACRPCPPWRRRSGPGRC